MARDYGKPPESEIDIENFTLRLKAIIINHSKLFEMLIFVYIVLIMNFKKAYMKREASKVCTYGQQWEETIHENKILDKAINR